MGWQDQINVTPMAAQSADLTVVNAARVSFNKFKDDFGPDDQKLLNYLAQHQHTTPFRHARLTMMFDEMPLDWFSLDPFLLAGMAWDRTEYRVRLRHSIMGWIQLLQRNLVRRRYRKEITAMLHMHAPGCMKAFNFTDKGYFVGDQVEEYTGKETNPWFLDQSFHCEAPIWLSRQLVKHQVMMSWNEVSRRYVDYPVELFQQEFRAKPDGSIKQGSAEAMEEHRVPYLATDERLYSPSDMAIRQMDWYDACIEQDVAAETVRGYMPLNMMTQWIWTGANPAWAHLIKLRMGHGAQVEAAHFAEKLAYAIAETA